VVALAVSVALLVPFVGAASLTASFVTPLGRAAADVLLALVAPLSTPELVAAPAVFSEQAPAEPHRSTPSTADPAKGPRRGQARPAKPAALFVSQGTVLELARSSARPQGAFVAPTADHPGGLRLSGVGGLGIGVQDGDILIEALGVAPRDPGDIIGAVLAARAKNARFLSGTLWRRGDTFRITVEQPYAAPPAKG
jgi:hypothetical protein